MRALPERVLPSIAAPMATHSSGLMLREGSFPVISLTLSCTATTRDEPPTRSTRSRSFGVRDASESACRTGPPVLSMRSRISSFIFALVRVRSRCTGSFPFIAMYGRLILVSSAVASSFFACSAASRIRCMAAMSFRTLMRLVFRNSSRIHSVIRSSKSSPPR